MSRGWLLRLAISGGLLAILFLVVPADRIWAAMGRISAALWLTAATAFVAGHAIAALKWRLLMVGVSPLPVHRWLTAHFAGLTANLCLPGVSGGDLVRAAWILRATDAKEAVVVASLADRLVDAAVLLMLVVVGFVGLGRVDPQLLDSLVWVAAAGLVAGTAAGAVAWWLLRRRRSGMIGRLTQAARLLIGRPSRTLGAAGLSACVQAGFVAINRSLGSAVGVQATLAEWLVAWPLAKLVATIPVSAAGFGVREGALVVFMAPFGVEAEPVVAAGLLWDSILVGGALIGALAGGARVAATVATRSRA